MHPLAILISGAFLGAFLLKLGDLMSTTRRVVVGSDPREKITVSLVGKEYVITPLKGSTALQMARRAKSVEDDPDETWEMLQTWIMRTFGDKNGETITKRLEDEADDLDIKHISKLMDLLAEAATGNPTT